MGEAETFETKPLQRSYFNEVIGANPLQRSHCNEIIVTKPLQQNNGKLTSFFLIFNSSLFVYRENYLVSL